MRPPAGVWGCHACADNVNMHFPARDRDPKHCRWYDKEDYYWECPKCKNNYGDAKPGHLFTLGN
eukprot:7391521-Pyramimonas_sp.AAC.1